MLSSAPRTATPRSGQLPTPRTDYVACQYGSNWVIHGGRVLLQDGVLGDTYVFHFPTAEWGRLDPESDTDPRFGHAGSTVDGALVLLHGKREVNGVRDPNRDVGVCIAINLETYIMFPDYETETGNDSTYAFSAHEHVARAAVHSGDGSATEDGGAGGVDLLGRVALTPGCQIGYMDRTGCYTGCHQLVF